MSLRVGVVPSSEVPVVAGDDGVLLSLLDVLSVPLTNARPTGIRQHQASYVLQGLVLQCQQKKNKTKIVKKFTKFTSTNQLILKAGALIRLLP